MGVTSLRMEGSRHVPTARNTAAWSAARDANCYSSDGVKQREPVRTGLHSTFYVQWQAQERTFQNERTPLGCNCVSFEANKAG